MKRIFREEREKKREEEGGWWNFIGYRFCFEELGKKSYERNLENFEDRMNEVDERVFL